MLLSPVDSPQGSVPLPHTEPLSNQTPVRSTRWLLPTGERVCSDGSSRLSAQWEDSCGAHSGPAAGGQTLCWAWWAVGCGGPERWGDQDQGWNHWWLHGGEEGMLGQGTTRMPPSPSSCECGVPRRHGEHSTGSSLRPWGDDLAAKTASRGPSAEPSRSALCKTVGTGKDVTLL